MYKDGDMQSDKAGAMIEILEINSGTDPIVSAFWGFLSVSSQIPVGTMNLICIDMVGILSLPYSLSVLM